MKTKIFLLLTFLLIVNSCKAQTTYSEETLKNQNNKITTLQQQKRASKSVTTVGDIINKLDVPVIFYSYDTTTWESKNVNLIQLHFYTDKEFKYKMDNKIKFHDIFIYIKKPLPLDDVISLTRKNKAEWTKEVHDYFKDMEVDTVNAN